MSYQLITVADTPLILIEDSANAANRLLLQDLRQLLQLRARIETYLLDLDPDAQLKQPPATPDEMISTVTARAQAADKGITVNESALRMAITRGHIVGATKLRGRWIVPRVVFEGWLIGYTPRNGASTPA